ncbi:adaptor protein complex AP-1, gamma subunit [Artemisia annua]|uniref:Adaptor protein complex AP-1, gamma subunit n=1 Tax=Artemisia annua TaxID=35608 RepID=A0A2U1Q6J7_ARTAN|nr:adaptor protein complex AP-1, gamma subunit [Artemisia annua]
MGHDMHKLMVMNNRIQSQMQQNLDLNMFAKSHEEEFDNEAAIVHTVLTDSEVSNCPICPNQLFTPLLQENKLIKDIVNQSRGSLLLELQQRSIEFDSMLEKHQNIRNLLSNESVKPWGLVVESATKNL